MHIFHILPCFARNNEHGSSRGAILCHLEVGHAAAKSKHKILGPLALLMIDIAQNFLVLWRQDEEAAMRFAAMVLAGPTNLRATTGQLPEPVASA